MNTPTSRTVNFAGFAACLGMMGYALYAEHVLLLMPCPLCIFQRIAVISLGLIFLVAALHDPRGVGRRLYAVLLLIAATAGAGVAGRHVWLQNLPPDMVPSCGPGFDYIIDSFPLSEALGLIFTGSGECASIDWQFLGMSMPAWVLISIVVVGVAGAWNNLRRIS
jgi:disulfide bond formation protein DsbB